MGLHFCTQLIKPIVWSLEHMKGQTKCWWLVDASESMSMGSLLTLEHFHPGSTIICPSSSQRPERGCWGREGVAGTGTCRSGTDRVMRLLSWTTGTSVAGGRRGQPWHLLLPGPASFQNPTRAGKECRRNPGKTPAIQASGLRPYTRLRLCARLGYIWLVLEMPLSCLICTPASETEY